MRLLSAHFIHILVVVLNSIAWSIHILFVGCVIFVYVKLLILITAVLSTVNDVNRLFH